MSTNNSKERENKNQRILSKFVDREVIHCCSQLVSELDFEKYEDEILALCYPQDECSEVFEHWIVTKWFAGKLAEKGEAVAELFDFWVWGRTCTGQAIMLDSVIEQIASDLEILAGQKHEWKVD